jgi:sugar phosphate isomerase/epimerase
MGDLWNWIRLAQDVQVLLLRVFGGPGQPERVPQPSDQEVNEWVAQSLRQVAPEAEQALVTIALETHDAFSSARRVAGVLRAVDSPYVAALWDSHHPYRVGETAQEVIEVLGTRLAHVHVKDARRVTPGDSAWQLTLLGEGEVPVREQLKLLVRYGYTGYVSVEWEKKWHPEIAEPEIALPQHIAWLKSIPLK